MLRNKVSFLAGTTCVFVFLLFMVVTRVAIAEDVVVLTLGQQKTIKAPGLNRIAVGNPQIADVSPIEKAEEVLITAVGPGKTNLIIWDKNDNKKSVIIEVISEDPKEVAREIRDILKDIEGIEIKPSGKRIVISGHVLKTEDLDKIEKISKIYPLVMNLTILSPAVVDIVVKHINDEFRGNNWKTVRAKKMAKLIALEGEVKSEADKQKAEMIAKAYYDKVINFLKVGVEIEQLININIDFVELHKDDRKDVGINWGDQLTLGAAANSTGGFGGGNTKVFTGNYSLVANYSVTMNLLNKKRNSRILAQPKLLCKSGGKADFLAGGEVAIPIVTKDTTSVEYKQYGIILRISPIADSEGNVETSIEIENSTISDINAQGTPSFHTSRVNTYVNGRNNETIVLSGILTKTSGKEVDKMPLLGDIPILGELFKSRSFQEDESELLIFVTPSIVGKGSQQMAEQVQEMRDAFEAAGEEQKAKITD
ncbi:MAG: hypothetical protein CSA26_06515 [Desulfobacterales bacterium]|nr:MAG: hypothetical protein CSA26_06515 [Desulfobacterales bacterium]